MKANIKIAASLIGVLLLIAAVTFLSFWTFRQIEEAAAARKHAFIVLSSGNELMTALIDAETGQRGFFLTGDEAFLEPYLTVQGSISGQFEKLRQLSITSAAHKHLDALQPLISKKLAYLSHNIELGRNHDMPAALADARGSQGKQLMDSIRTEMRGFIRVEEETLERHDGEFRSNMRHLFIVIVVTSVSTLLLALSFVFLSYRETQHRLKGAVYLETRHLLKIQEDMNKQLQQTNGILQVSEEKLAVTLNSIGDGVLTTDAEARVTRLNPVAEQLTGWTEAEASGRPVVEIFRIISEETRQPVTIPVMETLAEGVIQGLANHTLLISRAGSECAIADSCAPIRDREGRVAGAVLVFRDVTERREIEKGLEKVRMELQQANIALQVSEERFAVTLSSIGDGVLATDTQGSVTLLNPVAEKLTGWTQAEALGRPVADIFVIVNHDTRKSVVIPVVATLAYGTIQGLENHTVLIARDGSECHIADSCAPIRSREGQVIGAVLVFRDVTEETNKNMKLEKNRKELEILKRAADEAHEFSESIINTVREPLISLDQDLRVVTASRSFYEVFRVKSKETVGQLIYDLGNKQWDIPKLRELLENILPQKAAFDNYEVEHDFSGIGRRTMLLNARQIQRASGKERIILLAIEDITTRREIEKGLERTRKELADIKKTADEASEFSTNIIDTVREPLISLDQDLRVVTASRSFYEVFKVNPQETVGQLIYNLGNKQWDIPKLRELLENILPQQVSFDNYEVEHDFSDIGRRTMLLNARQIERASGKERIILLAIEDITQRKAAEESLRKLTNAKSKFTSTVSHELRSPLATIKSATDLVWEGLAGPVNEEQKDLLGTARENINRLSRLIKNVLAYKKMEAGKTGCDPLENDMNEVVQEVFKSAVLFAGNRKADLVMELGKDIPTIKFDRDKIFQVLMNLLSNAIKYSERGSVLIRTQRENNEIHVSVRDYGEGIKAEHMEEIFEPFSQTGNDQRGGTGLGLAITKEIVLAHHGRIWAKSEIGKGSTFHFALPV